MVRASDIPDALMVETIGRQCDANKRAGLAPWAFLWDLQRELSHWPPKVVKAKLKRMTEREIIRGWGCVCGCRGDFVVLR